MGDEIGNDLSGHLLDIAAAVMFVLMLLTLALLIKLLYFGGVK